MGSNTLTCLKDSAQSYSDEGAAVTTCSFTVCSGADDQSITVGRFALTITMRVSPAPHCIVCCLQAVYCTL
jgi:hypothetical protein